MKESVKELVEQYKDCDRQIELLNEKIKNLYLKDMHLVLLDVYNVIVDDIKPRLFKHAYYAGGTLCIDLDDTFTAMVNLDETFTINYEGKSIKRLLNLTGVKIIFNIYLKSKEQNEYFFNKVENSCIKHLIL